MELSESNELLKRATRGNVENSFSSAINRPIVIRKVITCDEYHFS